MMTRDYLSVKIWDLNMESRPVETYQVCNCCRAKTRVMLSTSVSFLEVVRPDVVLLSLHKREVFYWSNNEIMTPLMPFSLNRCTNISGVNCVRSMRMTASSTSLSAVGMGTTGERLYYEHSLGKKMPSGELLYL